MVVVFRDHRRRYLTVANNEIERAILAGGISVQRTVKQLLSRQGFQKAERAARKAEGLQVHSAPGEPPWKQTGHLSGSMDAIGEIATSTDPETGDTAIGGVETFKDERGFVARVGTNVRYAPFLEFGTSRMEARPYLRPALDSNAESIRRSIKRAGRRIQRRAP
jgi:HK97 gp10 family phage protein